jgi:hypothetical protein
MAGKRRRLSEDRGNVGWSDAQRVRAAHLLMRAMLAEEAESAAVDLSKVTLAALAGALVLASAPSSWPVSGLARELRAAR